MAAIAAGFCMVQYSTWVTKHLVANHLRSIASVWPLIMKNMMHLNVSKCLVLTKLSVESNKHE